MYVLYNEFVFQTVLHLFVNMHLLITDMNFVFLGLGSNYVHNLEYIKHPKVTTILFCGSYIWRILSINIVFLELFDDLR